MTDFLCRDTPAPPGAAAVTGCAVVSGRLARNDGAMTAPELLHGAGQVIGWVTAAAAQACQQAGVAGDALATAHCCFGTLYGTNHVAEYNFLVLGEGLKRALNPRAFALLPPNAAVASICGQLGIAGPGVTLLGMGAGVDAVEYGLRAIRGGRCRMAVCGGFDWPTPFAARLLQAAGVAASPEEGAAVALVLEHLGAARDRHATVLAELLLSDEEVIPQAGREPGPPRPRLTPAVAPLLEAATLLEAGLARPGRVTSALDRGRRGTRSAARLVLTTVSGLG